MSDGPASTLGWIGMGAIGTPMLLRLLAAGNSVRVWGRNKARLSPALAAGAREASSAAEVAAASEAVFLCVLDTAAVEDVVFGPGGVASGARPGSVLIDHSTIHPERTRDFARRLQAVSGMHWVDAPVSGGTGGAAAGTLSVFVGGDAALFERIRPWVAAYAKNVTLIGDVGSGQTAKSCNQTIVCTTLAVWAEVLAYARRAGVDPATLVAALEGGWADSAIRASLGPDLALHRSQISSLKIFLKDLNIVADMARERSSPMFLSALVAALFAVAEGQGSGGANALLDLYGSPSK